MQEERPIAFASKSLSQTEVGYAQIEKELLAIVFGLKRWSQFSYGRHVIVHSDHKSISAIMKIVSEYDQEIPQSQTADNPVAPRGRAAQPSRGTRKTN